MILFCFEFFFIVVGLWWFIEWQFDVVGCVCWIEQVMELGISSFDYVDIYGDYCVEVLFGEVLKVVFGLCWSMQLVSKCGIWLCFVDWFYWFNYYDILVVYVCVQVECLLVNLYIDQFDLVLIYCLDYLMDVVVFVEMFCMLIVEGKVFYWGVFNYSVSQFVLFY